MNPRCYTVVEGEPAVGSMISFPKTTTVYQRYEREKIRNILLEKAEHRLTKRMKERRKGAQGLIVRPLASS